MNIQIGRRASPAIAQLGIFLRERYFETTNESGFGGGGLAASGAAARGAGPEGVAASGTAGADDAVLVSAGAAVDASPPPSAARLSRLR